MINCSRVVQPIGYSLSGCLMEMRKAIENLLRFQGTRILSITRGKRVDHMYIQVALLVAIHLDQCPCLLANKPLGVRTCLRATS
jgi:hypothetical protein